MEWKIFFTIFGSVFIAELGDKTQFATMLFAADGDNNRILVFFAASCALVLCTLLGVAVGSSLSLFINEKFLHYLAGASFILIGIYTLITA